eukprot:g32155.t1
MPELQEEAKTKLLEKHSRSGSICGGESRVNVLGLVTLPQNCHFKRVGGKVIIKEKVLGKLKGLKVDKSPGLDGLHPRVVKKIAEEILE